MNVCFKQCSNARKYNISNITDWSINIVLPEGAARTRHSLLALELEIVSQFGLKKFMQNTVFDGSATFRHVGIYITITWNDS